MKPCLLLTLALIATFSSVRADLKEVVQMAEDAFLEDVAYGNAKLFVEADSLKDPAAEATVATFPKPKEEPTDPSKKNTVEYKMPVDLTFPVPHRVAVKCFVPENDQPQFCYQIWFLPARAQDMKDMGKGKKGSSFIMLIYLANSVVSSRIKATLASASQNQIIKGILRRGIQKFLAKLDQTLPSLASFKDDLTTKLPLILKNLGEVVAPKSDQLAALKTYFYEPVVGRKVVNAEEVSKQLLESTATVKVVKADGTEITIPEEKKKIRPLSKEKLTEVLKFFTDKVASVKSGADSPKVPLTELWLIKIDQFAENSESTINEMFAELVREVYLLLVNVEGRLSVHLRSDAFSFSKDLPVATKPALFATIQTLLHKSLVETYTTLLSLDSTAPISSFEGQTTENMIAEQVAARFNKLVEEMALPATINSKGEYGSVLPLGEYSVIILGSYLPSHGDYEVRISLVKSTKLDRSLRVRTAYIPVKSQFYLIHLASNFVKDVLRDYLELIFAEFINPQEVSKADDKNLPLMLKVAAYLSAGEGQAFLPDDSVSKIFDTHFKVPKKVSATSILQVPVYKLSNLKINGGKEPQSPKFIQMTVKETSVEVHRQTLATTTYKKFKNGKLVDSTSTTTSSAKTWYYSQD
jgi:hypothetical protein